MSAAARPPAGPSARPRGEFLPGDRILTSGRRGVVHFFGLVAFATGKYVGIELEEPAGKHDGSMKGERYFTCPPNHGVFVKPSMVQLDPDAVQPTPASAAASRVASRAGSRRPSIDEGAAPVAAAADTAPASAIQQPPTATVDLSSAVVHESPKKEPQQPAVSPELAASPPPKATFSLPPLAAVKSPVQTTTTITTPIVQPPVASVSLNLSAPVPSASPPLVPSGPTPEHQRLQAAFDQLQTAHSKLNQDAKQLQAALTSMTNEKDIILDEQKRLASELSARDRQIAELKTEMGTLETGGAQLESLQNMVEMLTLDKALAEEQNESSLAELETLKNQYANQELELQLLREQHASLQLQAAEAHQRQLAAAGSGPITAESLGAEQNGIANQKLLEQNALLTDALRKLRDLNLAEKQSSTSRISELEKINSGLAAADAENFKLRADLASAQASVASLKEQLDEALELQDMVEKLSQAKLDAEESVKERTRTVAYLESLVAASEEVEEGYKEFQAQLQSELTEKESNFLDLNERYKLKNLQIEDLQGTNRKFRDLVRQLEAENTVLKQKVVEGVASSPRGGSNANGGGAVVPLSGLAATRSSSLLTLRLKQVRTAHLDALLAGVERDLLSKRYQFLSLYLPGNISVDDRSLGFLQLLERLKSKASVLGRVWARFYGALDGEAQGESHSGAKVTVDYSANGTSPELVLLAYKACLLLASIVHAVENLTSSLYTLDVDAYNSICIRSTSEMTPLENILDAYLMMIQMDTLNELTSLASLVQANWILYSFLIEKVPLHAFVSVGAGQTHAITDELNVLPYQMAVWTVIRKVEGEQEVQKWNDLAASYRQRVSEYKRPQLPSGAVVPSSVPALGTFSLTLSYSAAMAQAYAQLIGDHVNSLVDALRRGRARKLAEVSDERSKKERHEAVGTEAAGALSVNASLEEYSNVEDADIAVYSSLWSDIADACLNNLSLSNQLHHTAVRNYQNSLGGNEEQRTKHEQAAVSLLPHMHAIDGLSQAVALQLAALYQAIRPLLQADSLTQLSTAISAEVVDGPPASPILQKLIALLEGAKPSGSDSSDSLLALLTKLRTELFTTSKSILSLTEANAQAQSDADLGSSISQASKAVHQRTASFVLTAPESTLTAAQVTDTGSLVPPGPSASLAAMQPWFHHPLTIRAQLSATASLRQSLQELTTRLSEKQKEVYSYQKAVSEEKAKQDVLRQQLMFHTQKANQHSEYATLNDNLKAQLEESEKQLASFRAKFDEVSRENRVVRKQMLKLKSQYLKEEQARTQTTQAGGVAAGAAGAVGSAPGAAGASSAITNLAALSSANLSELMGEVELLRRTLAAQREELALWKTKQTMHELETMLPPLIVEPPRFTAPPTFSYAIPQISVPSIAPGAHATFAQSKVLAAVHPRSNPLLSSLPPALSPSLPSSRGGRDEHEELRFLRAKVTEVAQQVWKERTAPKVVKVQPISRERQEEERKSKESEEEKSASPSAPAASLPSPYQQYIEQKVRAVQMQQVCDRLHQRVNAVADQQRLRQWSARM